MPSLATLLITLFLTIPAMSVELFRYRGAAKDGGTLEYVFEAGEQNSPNAVTKEKAAEIAADFMTTFYHVQVGGLETQAFRTTPHSGSYLLGHDQRTKIRSIRKVRGASRVVRSPGPDLLKQSVSSVYFN